MGEMRLHDQLDTVIRILLVIAGVLVINLLRSC